MRGDATVATLNRTAAFNAWLSSVSALPRPPVEIRPSLYGNGVFALRKIEPGEPVFGVPMRYSLPSGASVLPNRLLADRNIKLLLDSARSWPFHRRVNLQLLIGRALGPRSPMAAYYSLLPAAVLRPDTWSADNLEQLQDEELAEAARRLGSATRDEYMKSKELIAKLARAVADAGGDGSDAAWSYASYSWADTIVTSRTLGGGAPGKDPLFLPGPDMVNHAAAATRTLPRIRRRYVLVRRHMLDARIFPGSTSDESVALAKTDRYTDAGEELTEDYRTSSATKLLLAGFIAPRHHLDCFQGSTPPGTRSWNPFHASLYKWRWQRTVGLLHQTCARAGALPASESARSSSGQQPPGQQQPQQHFVAREVLDVLAGLVSGSDMQVCCGWPRQALALAAVLEKMTRMPQSELQGWLDECARDGARAGSGVPPPRVGPSGRAPANQTQPCIGRLLICVGRRQGGGAVRQGGGAGRGGQQAARGPVSAPAPLGEAMQRHAASLMRATSLEDDERTLRALMASRGSTSRHSQELALALQYRVARKRCAVSLSRAMSGPLDR